MASSQSDLPPGPEPRSFVTRSSLPLISRRDLIRTTVLAGVTSALAPGLAFSQERALELTPAQRGEDGSTLLTDPNWKPVFLNDQQNETLIALSEAIIPATDTPGAKEALVNRHLDLTLSAEPAEIQQKFLSSLSFIDSESKRLFDQEFRSLTPEDQNQLLRPLAYFPQPSIWNPEEHPDPGVEHFERLKSLIANAYYSSEAGQRELGWDGTFTHGPFQGCQHSASTHK